MAAFDPHAWYALTSAAQSINNTLTAANNTQAAFDPNSLSGLFYEAASQPVSDSQLWQIYPVNTSTRSAYVFRNRALGPNAYLTTAWTTRKCGGGQCATVPVLSPDLNLESLWDFGSWGFSDPTGDAFIYNLGNGSDWRLDTSDGSSSAPEILNYMDTNRLGSHWKVIPQRTFAANEAAGFSQIPSTATVLLAEVTGTASATVAPYTPSSTHAGDGSGSSTSPSSIGNGGSVSSDAGLSTGAAVGLGVGLGIAGVVIVLGLAFLFISHRRKKRRSPMFNQNAMPPISDKDSPRTFDSETIGTSNQSWLTKKHMNSTLTEMDAQSIKTTPSEMTHPSERARPELSANQVIRNGRFELGTDAPHREG